MQKDKKNRKENIYDNNLINNNKTYTYPLHLYTNADLLHTQT